MDAPAADSSNDAEHPTARTDRRGGRRGCGGWL